MIPGHFQRDPGATDLLYPDMISPLIPVWFPICGDHSPRHPPVKKSGSPKIPWENHRMGFQHAMFDDPRVAEQHLKQCLRDDLGNPTKVWLIPSSLLRLAGRASSGVTWRDDTWLVAGWYI